MVAGFWANYDQWSEYNFKTAITKEFNKVFKHAGYVPIWSDVDNRKVEIRKSNATKYYQKIEALTLHKYPLANLKDVKVPFNVEGKGLNPKIPKRKMVGRYQIHIPSLQQGYLYIQYPSNHTVKHFKKQAISSTMQDIMWDMVEEKQFSDKKYKKLSATEKKLYDDLIDMLKVLPTEIVGLGAHNKNRGVERDADLKRLKILSGEISAGNTSKDVIRQLKTLLLKMTANRTISKADQNRIIYELFLIDN